jgi:hypothetical protein
MNKKPCPICKKFIAKKSKTCINCFRRQNRWNGNGNWKGGKSRHKKGYIQIYTIDHPRLKTKPGYVFEHILKMEAKLQRYLLFNEFVHHKNGQKDDNRLTNLELWTKSHPTGIRVKDAINWAKEILKRYEGVMDSNG